MKAVLCPVCNGSGKIDGRSTSTDEGTQTCHGCGGKGWVEVRDEFRVCYPYRPVLPNPCDRHEPLKPSCVWYRW